MCESLNNMGPQSLTKLFTHKDEVTTISDKIGGPTDPKLELNPPLPLFQCCQAKTAILRDLPSMYLVVLLSKECNIERGGGGGGGGGLIRILQIYINL